MLVYFPARSLRGSLRDAVSQSIYVEVQFSSVDSFLEAIYIVYPSIHPLLHGLSTHRCSFAIFTIVLHVPRSCAFQLSVWISSPRHSLMSSNHSLHGLPLLYSSVPPSFQTSPPSPAYCPSSCICVQTGSASFP